MWKTGGSVLVVFCVVTACGSSVEHSTLPATPLSSATIGAAGGTVTSTDGTLSVAIPAGALTTATNITVTATNPTTPGFVGTAYDIGPTGTTFATPITLTFKVDPTLGDASKLTVALLEAAWALLPSTASGNTVATQTPHLSTYALATGCQPACAAGDDCVADLTGHWGCGRFGGDGADAGVDSGADSGPGPISDCTSTCTMGCCDKNNVCHTDGATNATSCGLPGGSCRDCTVNHAICTQGLCVAGGH